MIHSNYFKYKFYVASNIGRQIGVQLSAVLNDSVEFMRFNIK